MYIKHLEAKGFTKLRNDERKKGKITLYENLKLQYINQKNH